MEDLVTHLDTLVRSVPLDALRTVVGQLGIAFADSAQPLRRLLDTTSEFTQSAQDALPQTVALLHDGRTVLTTQNQTAGQFADFSRSLAQLADQLKTSDPDIRRLVQNGPHAADQVSGLLDESGSGLGDVVANLLTVSRILEPRQSNLDQILVVVPGHLVRGADGRARRRLRPPGARAQRVRPAAVHEGLRGHPAPGGQRGRGHAGERAGALRGARQQPDRRAGAQNVPQPGGGHGDPAAGVAATRAQPTATPRRPSRCPPNCRPRHSR